MKKIKEKREKYKADLAGVEGPGESNIHVVFEEPRVRLERLGHGHGRGLALRHVQQRVEVQIVQTLWNGTALRYYSVTKAQDPAQVRYLKMAC